MSLDSPDKIGALDVLITDLRASDNESSVAKIIEQTHILIDHNWDSQTEAILHKFTNDLQFPSRDENLESKMMK